MYEEDKSELNETEWNLFSDEHFSSNMSIKHYKANEDKLFFKWMIQYKHWAIENRCRGWLYYCASTCYWVIWFKFTIISHLHYCLIFLQLPETFLMSLICAPEENLKSILVVAVLWPHITNGKLQSPHFVMVPLFKMKVLKLVVSNFN